MTVGNRIKQRRIELGLTQSELSAKLGYKGKTSVCAAETWGDNITTTKVKKFAEALDVSFYYLMGYEDNTDSPLKDLHLPANEVTEELLSLIYGEHDKAEEFMKFYNAYKNTDPQKRAAILSLLESPRSDS